MDWDWKEFAWDPAELELSAGGMGEEKVTDRALKGPRLGDTDVQGSRSMADRVNAPKASKIVTTPTESTKRTRVQTGSQSIACLVDACSSDLGNCGDYHRRHRVCEQHSKAPIVILEGKQQRFCQQCSRFHDLGEFDEVKRSCRKRLDGHNRRRRKPKTPSLFMSGPRILQFNNPQICATPNVRSAFVKNEAKSKRNDHQQLWYAMGQQGPAPASYFTNKNRGRGPQFSLMQAYNTPAAPGVSLSNKLPHVLLGNGKKSQSHSDGTTQSIDSSCALYLLSSNSASTPGLNLIRSAISPPTDSHNTELHFEAADKHPSSLGIKNNAVLIQNADDTNNIIYNGMRHTEPVESGDILTLPFSWEQ